MILWIAFIFYNSSRNSSESSTASNIIVDIADRIFNYFSINLDKDILSTWIRKTAHFFEFFLLALFSYNFLKIFQISNIKALYGNVNIFTYVFVLGFCLVVAIIDEFIQRFSPGRANSIIDVGIDFLGSVFLIVLIVLINLKKIKSSLNKSNNL